MRDASSVRARVALVGWITAAAVCALLALEWLFLVTKPSMFTVVGWPQRGAILLASALLASIPVVVVALLLAWVWGRATGRWRGHAVAVGLVVPAVVLSAAAVLLIENFTKTVFDFNLGSFTSPVRYLYAVGWLLLAWRIHRSLSRLSAAAPGGRRRALGVGAALLVAASLVAAVTRFEPHAAVENAAPGGGELPDILILSSDGLNATHLSVYGYERPTTPFLESRVDEFLFSENHFSNSVITTASIGALLTGKPPMETGVLRAGDVFRGEHVFEHLPGLLRQLGYYNIDVSARFYGDPYDLNIRQGFHVANGRSLRSETLPVLGWIGRTYSAEVYFVSLTLERLRERVLHALGLADIRDFYNVVAKKFTAWIRDDDRIRMLQEEIERAPGPYFAHVHLLDTHRLPRTREGPGPARDQFPVRLPHYSTRPDAQWFDHYDDTIVGYDDYVRQVMEYLEGTGRLERTVLILNSDHGERRHADVRLPLMIRFPNAEHHGRITENTQRIDLAPTILSYLGLEPPEWMRGQSLIDSRPDPLRPILVAGQGRKESVRSLSVVQCHGVQTFTVGTATMASKSAEGHTAPCPEARLLDEETARSYLLANLEISGTFAIPIEVQLASLQRGSDPEMRQRTLEAIGGRQAPAFWFGDEIALTGVHPDLWTEATRPAAILLRNGGDRPRAYRLVVSSGRGSEFPATFHVQDEEGSREHVFSRPSQVTVDLGEVEPGSERLLVVWSDSFWKVTGERRFRGVRLSLSGSWLAGLLEEPSRREWEEAARQILDQGIQTGRLDDRWLVVNTYRDRWTRGGEPAGLAVRNDGDAPLKRRLFVRSGGGRRFPRRVHLHDGERRREYVFERPGRLSIDLPEVPPGAERLFVIRSEGGWLPESGPRRELGVRLSFDPA